jgi:formate hydrogenlyase transcriptional activator
VTIGDNTFCRPVAPHLSTPAPRPSWPVSPQEPPGPGRLRHALDDTERSRDDLRRERPWVREQARFEGAFDDVVGASDALRAVFAQVSQVAATNVPVLLLGETGTGKEMIARRLHQNSRREHQPLVSVNCAALPAGLVESELFGYEKGAFTGALKSTLGRFEAANGGTILLDEIGELPLELQPKLLRVLQSGEFTRLGSARSIRVDTRIIASTNRDLALEVSEGRFRADLYYRLSVFPITLPALRERPGDISLLVWHFITRKQAQLGKNIKHVPDAFMRALEAYSWPGNIRELENVIERALILSHDNTLASDWLHRGGVIAPTSSGSTLEDIERRHIYTVLDACGWKVAGKGNAAERLGLCRSTLQFRMRKLGISRPGRS